MRLLRVSKVMIREMNKTALYVVASISFVCGVTFIKAADWLICPKLQEQAIERGYAERDQDGVFDWIEVEK